MPQYLIEPGDHASIVPEGSVSNRERPIGTQRDARLVQVPAPVVFHVFLYRQFIYLSLHILESISIFTPVFGHSRAMLGHVGPMLGHLEGPK